MNEGDDSSSGGRRNALPGLQRFLALQMPDEGGARQLVTYDDALTIGQSLSERWSIFTGQRAPSLDEHGWADIVLFVLRAAWDRTGNI
jgi:hypothetical protein